MSTRVKIPNAVKAEAQKAFLLRDLGFRGGTETGWKRAKQLSSKQSISVKDLQTMYAWFARHLFTSYPGFREWKIARKPKNKSWHTKRSIISWMIWGSDPAFRWVHSKKNLKLLSDTYNKEYTKKTLRV